ncbi:VOC family protein [Candidatus Microgenomates bacterium]|nr:VOC family protein [Candidatus Microgenomates bacterium]
MENAPSNHEVKDPLGHVKLAVSDFALSFDFYKSLFSKLGYAQVSHKLASAGWVTPEGFGIWIAQAENDIPPLEHGAPGFHHLCMKAQSPQDVDELHTQLLETEIHIFNPPQNYPQYTENYYAVFFADPDGMKLEVAYY